MRPLPVVVSECICDNQFGILIVLEIVYQLFNAIIAENYGEKGSQVLARILEKLSEREIR